MPFQVSPDKMKPIQTNALLDKVCAFSSYLSGLLLLYSMATFSPAFSHSYLIKLLYAILHLVHLWSSQTILRWNRYVFIHTTNTEFSMLGFKATVLLNNFVAFTSIYLIVRAYVQDFPPFPAVGIIGSYLVTHIAINICMDRPSRPMTRHFLVYDPDTKDFFIGRDEKVPGVVIKLDERVANAKEKGDSHVWLTTADMADMVEKGGLGRVNLVYRAGIHYGS